MHKYIRIIVVLELLDLAKGKDIFPSTPYSSNFTSAMHISIESCVYMPVVAEQCSFFSGRMEIGKNHLRGVYLSGLLEWANSRLRFSEFLLSVIRRISSRKQLLSSTAEIGKQQRAKFVHEVDRGRYSYTVKQFY